MDMQTFRRDGMAVLSLGALWVWFFGAGNPGTTIFGLPTQDAILFRVGCQVLCSATLFSLSFHRAPFSRLGPGVTIIGGTLGCTASAILYRLGAHLGATWLVVLSCALTALSYALLLRLWMHWFRAPFRKLFLLVLLASALTMTAWLSTCIFSVSLGFGLALAAAVAAGISLRHAVLYGPPVPSIVRTEPVAPRGLLLQCAGVVVAYLSGSLLHMEAIGGLEEWAYLSLVGSAGLACWALWRSTLPRSEIFIALCLLICICTGCAVLGPIPPVFIGTLASAAFWLMFLFSIAWLGAWDYERARVPCSVFLRGAALLLLGAAVAKLAIYFELPVSSSLVLCALLAAGGLALFFTGNSHHAEKASTPSSNDVVAHPTSPTAQGRPANPSPTASLEERCSTLSRLYGLTDREEHILALLAQGNSLKKIADLLYMSEGTAKYHRHNIYMKLQVSTRQELIDLVGSQTGSPASKPIGQNG